jgi:hypothetical protein
MISGRFSSFRFFSFARAEKNPSATTREGKGEVKGTALGIVGTTLKGPFYPSLKRFLTST